MKKKRPRKQIQVNFRRISKKKKVTIGRIFLKKRITSFIKC